MIHGPLISHEFYSTVLKTLKFLPFTTLWENNKFMGLYIFECTCKHSKFDHTQTAGDYCDIYFI